MATRFQELTTYEDVKRWVDGGMRLYYRHEDWLKACPVTWPIAGSMWAELKEELSANKRYWKYGYLAEEDED